MHEQIHVASWPGVKWNNPEIYNGDEAYLPYSRIYAMQTQTFTLVASGLIGEAAKEFFAGGDKEKEAIIGSSGGVAQIIDPEGNDLCKPLPEDEEGILYAEIDLNNILRIKALLDPVGHYSRPDIFTLNINKDSNPMTKVFNEPSNDVKVNEINSKFKKGM